MFDEAKDDFFTFLRFQSIATDPAYRDETRQCCEWLKSYIEEAGLTVEMWDTRIGPPTLFASDLSAGDDKETLLIYCHYDVQPVDPLDLWETPPFEPSLRDGKVYARGASDNKGQCFYTIWAIKNFLRDRGKLPINLKFIIEGEEESGSEGLSLLLEQKKEALQADHILVIDSGMEAFDAPCITLGARGIVSFEVTVEESPRDLHSGIFGGIAYNPNRALVEMLAQCHDATGSVVIPGFYDEVMEPTPQEVNSLDMEFDEEAFVEMHGFRATGMESGLSPKEASWFRPTLEINGIAGGYAGAGFKTVIPSQATAKISCRLVPQQDPERIASLVKEFILSKAPEGPKTTVEVLHGAGQGFRRSPNSRITEILQQSYTDVFQKECSMILMGGSVPVTYQLAEAAGGEVLLIGTSLMTDLIHSPNEHFHITSFETGYQTIYRMLELFS